MDKTIFESFVEWLIEVEEKLGIKLSSEEIAEYKKEYLKEMEEN